MVHVNDMNLESLEVGAAPVVAAFLKRLELDQLLETFLPRKPLGRGAKIAASQVIAAMITNILISRRPLYGMLKWAEGFVPEHFGIDANEVELLNDDRLGRALDRVYSADRASLMTTVITRAVKTFEIDVKQLHCDTTTITFSGAYKDQRTPLTKDPPPLITFGHNKDHRPDLKQLVYALSVSADGAVPIHHKTYDGNTADDQIHKEVWSTLAEVAGKTTFLYVGDSKLCTHENMTYIASRKGRFLTVMPRSRGEYGRFCDRLRRGALIEWTEVRRNPDARGKDLPPIVYEAVEGDLSKEGYRVLWYRSSQKTGIDANARVARLERAKKRLDRLNERVRPFKSEEAARQAADKVLADTKTERWLRITVRRFEGEQFKQTKPGRPTAETTYRRQALPFYVVDYVEDSETIAADALVDGVFPLITNVKASTLSLQSALAKYKYQPNLEKRNEQLKSVYHVRPVLLQNPKRVTGLLFVYFLALLLWALIERELRMQMTSRKLAMIPLYPELRACKAPTTDGVFQALQGLRRHRLLDKRGRAVRVFYDQPTDVALQCLTMLGVPLDEYGIDA
jgi:transposase